MLGVKKTAIGVWLVFAWLLPAVIAGTLGWSGVWGNTSAFVDYLVPLPVAGGFLHLLTLGGIVGLLALSRGFPRALRQLVPAVLLGLALAGVVMLADVGSLYLRATTDLTRATSGSFTSQNPLGLFLVTDSMLALLWILPGREFRPRGLTGAGLSLVAIMIPPLLAARAMLGLDSRVDSDFLVSHSIPVAARGDDAVLVYSRRPPSDPGFRAAAETEARRFDPLDSFASDQALYFTNSLEAAGSRRTDAVFATYCMYEDGTPPMWLDGLGDCFGPHDSFDDLRHAAHGRLLAASVPSELAAEAARAEACSLARRPPPRERYMEVAALRSCADR
jgi:hypothetical protein